MATLTVNLTLTSSDASSDVLSLAATDTLTTTTPTIGISRVSVADAGTQVLYADAGTDGSVYIYIKNVNTTGTGYVELMNSADENFGTLQIGEFAFLPADTNEGIKILAGGATVVVEYAYWTRG